MTRSFGRGASMALVLLALALFLSKIFDKQTGARLATIPYLYFLGFLIVAVGIAVWVRRRDAMLPIEPSEGYGFRYIGGIGPHLREARPDRPRDEGAED